MKTINLSSVHPNPWSRQFPHSIPEWEGWKFVFNAEEEPYDYLVVFDDLHAPIKPHCPEENILHLATEPPSVHRYDENFLRQFAWVITQNDTLKHSGKILHQPGLTWFIGWQPGETDNSKIMSFDELEDLFGQPKSRLISVIASNKTFTPEHKARLEFAQKLKEHYGDKIDFYGRGFFPMDDKLDSLKNYRFQVVLENSSHNHYFSEKLTDCVLAGTYPIYYGCPNLHEYFSENSYLRIDIQDFDGSVALIDQAIAENYDKKYRAELLKSRDQTLYEHNLFPMLINIIKGIEDGDFGKSHTNTLYSEDMLPFGHKKFQTLFGSKVKTPLRIQLSNLANQNPFFSFLRSLYHAARRR
jgi:hypothetical protein